MAANGGLDLVLRERRRLSQLRASKCSVALSDITHSNLGLPCPLGVLGEVLLDVGGGFAVDLLSIESVARDGDR